jgi:uncharacterized membrane protein
MVILAISYWLHLLTTVLWLGGLMVVSLIALPAYRRGELADNQWLTLQKSLLPYINGSMALLWVTGFYQMTNNVQYSGFLVIDSTWAWAMLAKHVAVVGMTALSLLMQFQLLPEMERVIVLGRKLADQRAALARRETRLLRINLLLATIVLLFTALATAT